MNQFNLRFVLFVVAGCMLSSGAVSWHAVPWNSNHRCEAASPESIEEGRRLFNHEWTKGNPAVTSDGLGPLFNGQSCASCHHQGGVGGGGDARFNAHTVGIESLRIDGGSVDDSVLRRMVAKFHPGFIQPDGTVLNAMAVSHHGGSSRFAKSRAAMQTEVPVEFAPQGGPTNASEVRYGTHHQIQFVAKEKPHTIRLTARMFGRNTSALFGAGLIDQIDERELQKIVNQQKKHPEVSGRLSTLLSGKIGKFGWRANQASLLEFTDQASANEIGLETKQSAQASDPTVPHYKNTGIDITNQQLLSLRDFVASLPAPRRQPAQDSKHRIMIDRGETLFASVGCAVCHVPNVGPATEIYSDLLLHDMGSNSFDLNHAEPYIRKRSVVTDVVRESETTQTTGSGEFMTGGGYYGPAARIMTASVDQSRTKRRRTGRNAGNYGGGAGVLNFSAPQSPNRSIVVADTRHRFDRKRTARKLSDEESEERFRAVDADLTEVKTEVFRTTESLRLHIEPTNFNQEWRTPPLWGVADSAPYMHDGRAETLLESIAMHDGEAAGGRDRFLMLSMEERRAIIQFLETFKAPRSTPRIAKR